MGRTEYLVVRITPAQKRAIFRMARKQGLSPAAWLAQAASEVIQAESDPRLPELLARMQVSTQAANAALDSALGFIAETKAAYGLAVGGS